MGESVIHGSELKARDHADHLADRLVQVRILYGQFPSAQLSHIAAALLVFALLIPHVPLTRLATWFVFVGLTVLIRIEIAQRYRNAVKSPETAQFWYNWFLLGTVLYGAMWSGTAIILVPAQPASLVGLTSFVLCALAAGSVAISSVNYRVFLTYACSTLWPYAGFLIASQQDPHRLFGWLMIIFFVIVSIVASNVNHLFAEFIRLQSRTANLENTVERELNRRKAAERAFLDNALSEELLLKVRQQLSELNREVNVETSGQHQDAEAEKIRSAFQTYLGRAGEVLERQANAFGAAVELLKQTRLTSDQLHYVSMLESIERNIPRLLGNLAESARMNSGTLALRQDAINVRRLLIYLVHELSPVYQAKHLRVRRRVDSGIPQTLYGDSKRLKEMLRQLLLNAVRYTEKGHVDLIVSSLPGDNSDEFRFEVVDTGSGIDQDTIDALTHGGEGLTQDSGLSTVCRLATLQGGRVFAEGDTGGGSRVGFVVSLSRTTN